MTKIRIVLLLTLVAGTYLAQEACAQEPTVVKQAISRIDELAGAGPFLPTWESLEQYRIPPWYQDAKFGIFIHWGVYSVPAFGSEWYPRNMYINQEDSRGDIFRHHREKWGAQSTFGYKDFVPMFKAERFDPSTWAQLFKEAGAQYVVPVAEHHDGFPMYACSYTEWDASEKGPKRDIISELATAVRANGMKFGVSSHRAFNWAYYVRSPEFDNADPRYESLYGRAIPWLFTGEAIDHRNPWPEHDGPFKDDWLARTCELIDEYEPDLIWFDFGIAHDRQKTYDQNPFAGHLKRFAAYYYNHAAKRGASVVVNYKWEAFPEKAAVLDLERSKMDKIRYPFWQTDTAVSSSSWGYTENQKYKTTDRLVDDLVDIVSKNGCLLLNVGPRPDGTIPDDDQRILREMGQWLKVNGQAIYGTRPWKVYGEGPTVTATGHLSESKNKPFTPEDIRFTAKAGVLYAIVLGWPNSEQVTIQSLGTGARHYDGEIGAIELLGSEAKLDWNRGPSGLVISLPDQQPCECAVVFKVTAR